jgi:hypothetical protein
MTTTLENDRIHTGTSTKQTALSEGNLQSYRECLVRGEEGANPTGGPTGSPADCTKDRWVRLVVSLERTIKFSKGHEEVQKLTPTYYTRFPDVFKACGTLKVKGTGKSDWTIKSIKPAETNRLRFNDIVHVIK